MCVCRCVSVCVDACCVYLLLAEDQQTLRFDGMIRGQILSAASLDAILESFPNAIPSGPGHADVMPLPVVDQKRQLSDLEEDRQDVKVRAQVSTHGDISSACCTCLVVYEYLHRVVAPFYEDQLVGLTRNRVGERCAHSRGGVGLEPHAHSEGVHLRQALLHFGVHVVGSQGERQLEFIQRPVVSLTCGENKPFFDLVHFGPKRITVFDLLVCSFCQKEICLS